MKLKFLYLSLLSCLLSSCYTNIPVQSTEGLLAPGTSFEASTEPVNRTAMKNQTVAVITGANFEKFVEDWRNGKERDYKSIMFSREQVDLIYEGVSPARIATYLTAELAPIFSKVIFSEDFAKAKESGAPWVVLVDFSRPGVNVQTFTYNTSMVLLTQDLKRVVSVVITPTKTIPLACVFCSTTSTFKESTAFQQTALREVIQELGATFSRELAKK